jgi:hypothetical protein
MSSALNFQFPITNFQSPPARRHTLSTAGGKCPSSLTNVATCHRFSSESSFTQAAIAVRRIP